MYIVYIRIYCIYCWFPFPHFILNFTRMKRLSVCLAEEAKLWLSVGLKHECFLKNILKTNTCAALTRTFITCVSQTLP